MASHQLTIDKAKFSAGLLKPDITTISRDQISSFLELLDTAISQCTPRNIQSCKTWLSSNIIPSSARVGVLGKYLVSLARAQSGRNENAEEKENAAAFRRRGLHILYLLNDLLHHTKYHTSNSSQFSTLSGSIQPFLVDLVDSASVQNWLRVRVRLGELLRLWGEEGYFSQEYVDKLKEVVTNSATGAASKPPESDVGTNGQPSDAKEQPYVMPASHGDPSTPYHDLPAGNMMPHIMPNRAVPIRPDDIRALQFVAGPADESLVTAVKDFMTAVSEIDTDAAEFREDEGMIEDIDELGQHAFREETGDLVAGRTYYGWSRDFCDRMKRRGQAKDVRSGRERSYSSSRSRSRSPRKRRRYSDSASSRSASWNRSRSRPRASYSHRNGRHERSWSNHGHGEDRSRSRSRSRSYSPSAAPVPPNLDNQSSGRDSAFYQTSAAQEHRQPAYPLPQAIPPPPSISPPNFPFGPHAFPPPPMPLGGVPIPPPPPPNYSGPWPPPPPPIPPSAGFGPGQGVQPYHVPQGFPRAYPEQGGGGEQGYAGSGAGRWQRRG